jgi:hypothetical protein
LGWDASFSGGGVTMAAVFCFLDEASACVICCFLLALDLAILIEIDGGIEWC